MGPAHRAPRLAAYVSSCLFLGPVLFEAAGAERGARRRHAQRTCVPFCYPCEESFACRAPARRDSCTATQVKDMTRGVMQRVDSQLTMERDPDERIARLFSRRSPDCIPPGSIVMVESYLNSSKTSTTTFAGVLIAVRRAGIATTFLLRTIAHKLGVEMRYHAYSPMIKEIKVLQAANADKRQPGLTRTRRAKLYYMRRNDDRRVLSVANVVKQYRAAQMQEHKSSTESRKRS